jgi:hypothetical protein
MNHWQKAQTQIIFAGEVARQVIDHNRDYQLVNEITPEYISELIQTAASSLAALEDTGIDQQDAIRMVRDERIAQTIKHGAMPLNHDPLVWLAVIAEELGEAAEEVNRVPLEPQGKESTNKINNRSKNNGMTNITVEEVKTVTSSGVVCMDTKRRLDVEYDPSDDSFAYYTVYERVNNEWRPKAGDTNLTRIVEFYNSII